MNLRSFFVALFICVSGMGVLVQEALACTGVRTGQTDRFVMAKSYDWDMGYGLVVFNPTGLEKSALNLDMQLTPVKWTSKYPSITFDQYGCEMPNGGLNSAGLAIELMILGQAEFPPPDDRPALNELQFIQYSLDTFASVSEMIEGVDSIRIESVYAPVHYLACDTTGACAAFEWLGGELLLSTGDGMPAPTLTNSTYASSAAYLAQFEGFGGTEAIPESTGSLDRFVRASSLAMAEADGSIPEAAFSILTSVSQGDFSKWNIVYDLSQGTIYFRTLGSALVKHIALADFDSHCSGGRYVLDIDHPDAGDAHSAFAPYSLEANKALIEKSLGTIPDLPPVALELLAMYPDSLKCVPQEDPAEPQVESLGEMSEVADVVEGVAAPEIQPVDTPSTADLPALEPDSGNSPDGGCAIANQRPPRPWQGAASSLILLLLLGLLLTYFLKSPETVWTRRRR